MLELVQTAYTWEGITSSKKLTIEGLTALVIYNRGEVPFKICGQIIAQGEKYRFLSDGTASNFKENLNFINGVPGTRLAILEKKWVYKPPQLELKYINYNGGSVRFYLENYDNTHQYTLKIEDPNGNPIMNNQPMPFGHLKRLYMTIKATYNIITPELTHNITIEETDNEKFILKVNPGLYVFNINDVTSGQVTTVYYNLPLENN